MPGYRSPPLGGHACTDLCKNHMLQLRPTLSRPELIRSIIFTQSTLPHLGLVFRIPPMIHVFIGSLMPRKSASRRRCFLNRRSTFVPYKSASFFVEYTATKYRTRNLSCQWLYIPQRPLGDHSRLPRQYPITSTQLSSVFVRNALSISIWTLIFYCQGLA